MPVVNEVKRNMQKTLLILGLFSPLLILPFLNSGCSDDGVSYYDDDGYYYYYGLRDYARALDEFTFAQRREPGNAMNLLSIAYIQRRLAKIQDAAQNLVLAFQYNPRSSTLASTMTRLSISSSSIPWSVLSYHSYSA